MQKYLEEILMLCIEKTRIQDLKHFLDPILIFQVMILVMNNIQTYKICLYIYLYSI